MLFFTLISPNFTNVRPNFLSSATFVWECVSFGVNHIQTAYSLESDRTENWSKRNFFDYGTSLNDSESQLKINSGEDGDRQAVLVK
jgi:hypothetical protein